MPVKETLADKVNWSSVVLNSDLKVFAKAVRTRLINELGVNQTQLDKILFEEFGAEFFT